MIESPVSDSGQGVIGAADIRTLEGMLGILRGASPQPGSADIWCFPVGDADVAQVGAVFAAMMRFARGPDGTPAFRGAHVIVPESLRKEAFESAFAPAFESCSAELVSSPPPDGFDVKTELVTVLSGERLEAAVERAGDNAAVMIIGLEKFFTAAATAESDRLGNRVRTEEDVWVPAVHAAIGRLHAIAERKRLAIVGLVRRLFPERAEHAATLQAIRGSVVGWSAESGMPGDERVRSWAERVRAGEHVDVLNEIRLSYDDPILVAIQSAQVLMLGGRPPVAFQRIAPHLDEILAREDVALPLVAAEVAHACGHSDVALRALQAVKARSAAPLDHARLRLFHRIATAIGDAELLAWCREQFLTAYPDSPDGIRESIVPLIVDSHEAEALVLLAKLDQGMEVVRYLTLLAKVSQPPELDVKRFIDEAAKISSVAESTAALDAARILGGRDKRKEAAKILSAHQWHDAVLEDVRGFACSLYAQMALAGSHFGDEQDEAQGVLSWLVRQVARVPADGKFRERVLRLLSPESGNPIGGVGLLKLISEGSWPPARDPTPIPVRPLNVEELQKELPSLNEQARRVPFLGQGPIDVSNRELSLRSFYAILRVLEEGSGAAGADGDLKVIQFFSHLGLSLCGQLGLIHEEPVALALSAQGFIACGEKQTARDTAEHGLKLAGHRKTPAHTRAMWEVHADTHHRAGGLMEAMLGLACAVSIDLPEQDVGHSYSEWRLAARLMRDVGDLEGARVFLGRARAALPQRFRSESHEYRLDCLDAAVATQAHFGGWQRKTKEQRHAGLVDLVVIGCELIERARRVDFDDLPALAIAAQACRTAEIEGLLPRDEVDLFLDRALKGQPPHKAARVRAMVRGSVEELIRRRNAATPAFYAEDLAADEEEGRLIARRCLSNDDRITVEETAFVIEWLSDHSIRSHRERTRDLAIDDPAESKEWLAVNAGSLSEDELREAMAVAKAEPEVARLARLPSNPAEVANQLEWLDTAGLDVHMFAATDNRSVVHVSAAPALNVIREPIESFNAAAALTLRNRGLEQIGRMDRADPAGYNEVERAMRGIQGDIAVREGRTCLLVFDDDLHGIPGNLLRTSSDFLGALAPTATSPSLSWLMAVPERPATPQPRFAAWIANGANAEATAVLSRLRTENLPTLERHGFTIADDAEPGDALTGAELAFVGAHGGTGQLLPAFGLIADETDNRMTPLHLARWCSGTRVVVLAVCHAGRIDGLPFHRRTFGLAQLLLSHGAEAVVAAPWSLDVAVVRSWLPEFLSLATSGEPVAVAAFRANRAVRASRTHPADQLAMHVYGNPLAVLATPR